MNYALSLYKFIYYEYKDNSFQLVNGIPDGVPLEINGTESKYQIKFPARTFDYGSYRLFLNVTMIGELGIYSINSTDFNILQTPLHAEISAGGAAG